MTTMSPKSAPKKTRRPERAKKDTSSQWYNKTTLKNGVRVITERMPSVRSISLGVWVDVGSRNERPEENGLSHFIEHLVFKGTKNRNARQIAQSLESLGGVLNAFTTREQTCFTARVLDEHLPQAMEVLADLTSNATFSKTNMERERLVISEEIKESRDNPADHIHDLFADAYWGGHPLGQPIMGPQETILGMPRARLTKFVNRHYRSNSIVVAAVGAVSHDKLVRLVRKYFDFTDGTGEQPEPAERINPHRVRVKSGDYAQTQYCIGFPGLSYPDQRKMAAMVMASHLGGGMSSVLFQKIREQRGLAYSVYCYHDFYADAGILGIYLGTDHEHLKEAVDVILAETRRLKQRKIPEDRLAQVKSQIKGHLTLGMEGTSNRMHRLGRLELMLGEYVTLEQALKAIDKVTASDVVEMAREILVEDQYTMAALGPIDESALAGY
ncbi:insulinase family protein [candidate division GN15 bacterium]|nr:insulinase family protein [candidate division GN15 bacterium]